MGDCTKPCSVPGSDSVWPVVGVRGRAVCTYCLARSLVPASSARALAMRTNTVRAAPSASSTSTTNTSQRVRRTICRRRSNSPSPSSTAMGWMANAEWRCSVMTRSAPGRSQGELRPRQGAANTQSE
jgi:hypothetical protein